LTKVKAAQKQRKQCMTIKNFVLYFGYKSFFFFVYSCYFVKERLYLQFGAGSVTDVQAVATFILLCLVLPTSTLTYVHVLDRVAQDV
jgi:hypothetical protein